MFESSKWTHAICRTRLYARSTNQTRHRNASNYADNTFVAAVHSNCSNGKGQSGNYRRFRRSRIQERVGGIALRFLGFAVQQQVKHVTGVCLLARQRSPCGIHRVDAAIITTAIKTRRATRRITAADACVGELVKHNRARPICDMRFGRIYDVGPTRNVRSHCSYSRQ